MTTIKKIVLYVMIMAALGAQLPAQVQSNEDIITPTPQFQDHGGVTPWFWIGIQTVFSAGYNMETGAGGFRNYGGDNHTSASFNLAFVDSHYQAPRWYEVPRELDPNAWTGHFTLFNFTSRINSWESGSTGVENVAPAWLAEITGKGARIGFFTQAGELLGGLTDESRTDATSIKPYTTIYGGNKVLNLESGQLGKIYYEKSTDPNSVTAYQTAGSSGGIMYAGYEKKELWNVYLSMLSEGDVNVDVSDGANDGFAGVIDFDVTPFGVITDEEAPLTFNIAGNAIAGFNFEDTTENVGFGLAAESGIWMRDNLVLMPQAAFDGKIDINNDFAWKTGAGLMLQFSGMRWADDEWGDLTNQTSNAFYNYRYENNKVLKYAYAQVYGAYSETSDLNILLRVEEPDGDNGFHQKLGFMAEGRLYSVTEKENPLSWEAQARVSWDLNVKQYTVTPYLRGYLNDATQVKLRVGAYANFIPFTGFEIAYTSANLNKDADITQKPLSHYDSIFDAGRLELVVILKSDSNKPQVPKRMSDWNYPASIQDN